MKLMWFLVFVLTTLVAFTYGDHHQSCPQGFSKHDKGCTAKRPVHGNCPPNSKYNTQYNLCFYESHDHGQHGEHGKHR
uniref:Putative secreted protein n=1 Tax=Corethrella appendiculata TaxID=1370023 RepID=U5EPH2_9DIPT